MLHPTCNKRPRLAVLVRLSITFRCCDPVLTPDSIQPAVQTDVCGDPLGRGNWAGPGPAGRWTHPTRPDPAPPAQQGVKGVKLDWEEYVCGI